MNESLLGPIVGAAAGIAVAVLNHWFRRTTETVGREQLRKDWETYRTLPDGAPGKERLREGIIERNKKWNPTKEELAARGREQEQAIGCLVSLGLVVIVIFGVKNDWPPFLVSLIAFFAFAVMRSNSR